MVTKYEPKIKKDFISHPYHVWYLAHPIAADGEYSTEENLEHARKVLRLFLEAGIYVTAPWIPACEVLDDTNVDHRRLGLDIDTTIVSHLRKLILTGHRVSEGMYREIAAIEIVGGWVVDLTGIPDHRLVGEVLKAPLLPHLKETHVKNR